MWSAVTQGGSLKKKMPRYPVSPKGVLLIVLLDLFKVRKMYFLKLGGFLVLMHM